MMQKIEISRHLHVLFVDDNPGDIELAIAAVEKSGITCEIKAVRDGTEALAFLSRAGNFLPDLILLDWNMPKMSGLEILTMIKNSPEFSSIAVIIFSSSELDKHIDLAYEAGANCYIIKPSDFDKYMDCIASILRFWSRVTKMPKL